MNVVRSFRELPVHERARRACLDVFEISKGFPREERYSLTDQIRRSSRASKNLLAEAWGRRRYIAAFVNKIDEALAEANEPQGWLDDAQDCGYVTKDQYTRMIEDWVAVAAMLSRMIDRAASFCPTDSDTDYRLREETGIEEFFLHNEVPGK